MYDKSTSSERIAPSSDVATAPKPTSSQRHLNILLGGLTGLAVLSTALLIVLAVGLRRENEQLLQQMRAIKNTDATMQHRIDGLEEQTKLQSQNLALLNRQVPKGLANQLQAISQKLSTLQAAEAKAVTHQQMEQNLQQVLKQQEQAATSNPALSSGRHTSSVNYKQGASFGILNLPPGGNCPGTTSENCRFPSVTSP